MSVDGDHYDVDNARIYTLPDTPPGILISGFGPESTKLDARIGDGFMTVPAMRSPCTPTGMRAAPDWSRVD